MRALAAVLVLAACSKAGELDRERAAALFSEVPIATENGLSGLAVDEAGALWTVAERASRAYRIQLGATDDAAPTVEPYPISGMPKGFDLEGIAALGGGRFALGTEGREDGVATVLLAETQGRGLAVTKILELPQERVGVPLEKNHGAEGVCGAGGQIVAAIETAGVEAGKRWAPIVRISDGQIVRTHKLWLTSKTGKISGLDCRLDADGTVRGWAIERHFEVTAFLRFTLPPVGTGTDDVMPEVALDLGKVVNSKLNLEGIAELADGRLVAVVDNQWRTITGPNELLVFRPGVAAPAAKPAPPAAPAAPPARTD